MNDGVKGTTLHEAESQTACVNATFLFKLALCSLHRYIVAFNLNWKLKLDYINLILCWTSNSCNTANTRQASVLVNQTKHLVLGFSPIIRPAAKRLLWRGSSSPLSTVWWRGLLGPTLSRSKWKNRIWKHFWCYRDRIWQTGLLSISVSSSWQTESEWLASQKRPFYTIRPGLVGTRQQTASSLPNSQRWQ